MRVLALCALVACTYDEKQFDGPFTCFGAPPPTTADLLVKIAGTTSDPSNLSPIAGVTVVLQDAQMNPIFTPATTDAMGNFSFSLNTNGTPVDGVDLYASASGKIGTYYYPSREVIHDITFSLAVLSTLESSALAGGAGIQFTAGDGNVLLSINDCNDTPVSGATVTSSPSSAVRYFDGVQPSTSATATDAGGVVLIANLPPGKVTVTATVAGMVLPARAFTVVADSFVQSQIVP